MSYLDIPRVPALTGAIDNNELVRYLIQIQGKNKDGGFGACQFAHGITAVANAYRGGVYSPTQNRIYLVPYAQAPETNWHYIQEYSIADVAPALAANGLFNKL